MPSLEPLSRRSFLVSVAATGGGMVLGLHLPLGSDPAQAGHDGGEINAWVVIQPDETVIIRVARSEMGQGIFTALPMLVAEELECDWSKVRPEFASPNENLKRHRVWGDMSTGASRAVSASQDYLRHAGAVAREMLISAAAARWNAPASECRAENSVITHRPSGRTLTFGQVAEAAAHLEPPAQVALKDPKDWKLIGTPQKRFDIPDKVTGKTIYGTDVRLPGMLYAAIVQCPVFKGRLQSVDEEKIAGTKGIRQIVKLPDAVAVIADSWWQAKQAIEALPVTWATGDNARVSGTDIDAFVRTGLDGPSTSIGRRRGDVVAGLAAAVRRVEADYAVPFLAHVTMEPQNCTAHVTAQGVEIWVPTQDGETALATAASAANVRREKVIVHKTMLGGGFGRRGTVQDFVRQAVLIAKEVPQPVKMLWTREEDIRHDLYRPVAMARMTAGLDAAGRPTALKVRVAGQSILASIASEFTRAGADRQLLQGLLEEMVYDVPNYLVDYAMRNTHVPVGVWRSVNHSQNAFFKESFVDEMAHAAGQDPYLYRRRLLSNAPKHLAVLDAAATRAGWTAPSPPGIFRGIACHEACNSICAQVVEVSVSREGAVRVHRVVSAIDTGYVVNPLTIEMQNESAIVYALTAALYGEITIKDGRVEQSNFHDCVMLRPSEMPKIETLIVPSGDFWGGAGEPPLPPVAPALCNAIFAATGKRIRKLPLKNHDLRPAI